MQAYWLRLLWTIRSFEVSSGILRKLMVPTDPLKEYVGFRESYTIRIKVL